MVVFWKWLALAAGLYGLLAVVTVLTLPQASFGEGQLLEGLGEMIVPPAAAARIDFEREHAAAVTRPPTLASVVEVPGGQHVLRWEFPVREIGAHALILPLAPPQMAGLVSLDLRAEQQMRLALGVRERDGSVYLMQVDAGPQMRNVTVPFGETKRNPLTPDENEMLDIPQIDALVLIHSSRAQAERLLQQAMVEIDNVELR